MCGHYNEMPNKSYIRVILLMVLEDTAHCDKVWQQDQETSGHMVSAVGWLSSLSPFHSVQDSSPWNNITLISQLT